MKKQKGVVFLPILIVVLLLGTVGYFIYQNYQLKKGQTAIPQITSTPIKLLTEGSTSAPFDWEKHIDKEYLYSIDYPSIYKLTVHDSNGYNFIDIDNGVMKIYSGPNGFQDSIKDRGTGIAWRELDELNNINAGDEMNEAIINYVKLKYSLLLGESTSERVKIEVGKVAGGKDKYSVVRGRDLEKGLPKSIKLSSAEVQEALVLVVQEIVGNVVELLEETPPELVADILEHGIVMAGGGSLLGGIDTMVAEATKMPVWIADDPITCVARGCGKVLEDQSLLNKIRVTRGL
ncbi:rod shape-determining protein [Patescibacteria group bacterium]